MANKTSYIIKTKSTWEPEGDRNISEIVKVSISGFNNHINKCDDETILPLNLHPVDSSLEIEIKTEDEKFMIQHIDMLSEARIVEVFGKHDMYIKSVTGVKYEEEQGKFYKVGVSLDLPSDVYRLTLLQRLNRDSFRLLRIQVTIVPNMNTQSMQTINYNNVDNLLSGISLSDKAEKCKNFVQNFNKNNSSDFPNFLTCGLKNGLIGGISFNNVTSNSGEMPVNGKVPNTSPCDTNELFRMFKQLDEKLNRILDNNRDIDLFFRTKTEEISNQIKLLNEKVDRLAKS